MPKNALIKTERNTVHTIDSREVAEMMGIEHKELLKKIRVHIENLNEGKISPVKYFKETTYKDAKGERRIAYEIPKRGCQYIAHKMTGAKGNM